MGTLVFEKLSQMSMEPQLYIVASCDCLMQDFLFITQHSVLRAVLTALKIKVLTTWYVKHDITFIHNGTSIISMMPFFLLASISLNCPPAMDVTWQPKTLHT